ncbi:MAG: glycosyltransferase [bacterium]|nr:glycosyltransferase [bacterium]
MADREIPEKITGPLFFLQPFVKIIIKMLSIIIPTLNEEAYLSLLLDSIKKQNFKDFEIVVSDAYSKDRTRDVARKYGCKIVDGGLPAKGRNQGAAAAQGDLFLFLDAETLLSDNFLKKVLQEFNDRNLDVSGCGHIPIGIEWAPKAIHPQFFYNLLYNWPVRFLQGVFPYAASLILVKREIFQAVGGFDENIKIAEDHDFVRRAAKVGRFGFLKGVKLPLFLRRFEKEGLWRTNFKYFFCNILNIFFGNVKINIFRYDFGQYQKKRVLKGRDKKAKKTNFLFQFVWIIVSYLMSGIVFLSWILIFLLFTPKIVILKTKNILKR